MFEQKLVQYEQLPARQTNRKCTDVFCTILSSVFALTMFILAFCLMNKSHFILTNFPTDSDWIPCGYNQNQGFSYIYFPNIKNKDKRVCVSTCPNSETLYLLCRPNSKVPNCIALNIYSTSVYDQRLGGFCFPDDEKQRAELMNILNLQNKYGYLDVYDSVRLGLIISLCVGILYMIFVHVASRYASGVIVVLAALMSVGIALLAILTNKNYQNFSVLRIFIIIVSILLAIFLFSTLFLYRRRIKITGVLLSYASQCLQNQLHKLILIPVFLLFSFGLIILILFQYISYTSSAQPISSEEDIYLHNTSKPFLTFLCLIQLIWGLQFLKDTFNFIITGNISEWYIREGKINSIVNGQRGVSQNCFTSVARLFKFNWGSVAGGSFINAFFSPFNFIFETLRCYPEGACPIFAKPSSLCSYVCCNHLCDLVRTDSYAYINLTGIPYCNASRNCQELIQNSSLFIGSQSVLYFYRFCANIFCWGIVTIAGSVIIYNKLDTNEAGVSFYSPKIGSIIILVILAYCIGMYFIDIHANIAQALQISYLLQKQYSSIVREVNKFEGIRGELQALSYSYKDGQI